MGVMSRDAIQSILEMICRLAPAERVALADEVDRVTWRDRIQSLLADVQARDRQGRPLPDEEIDRIVGEVRSEKPLYERYWIRRRRSAP